MRRSPPGIYVEMATAGERFRAFVPAALPPDPPIVWSSALRRRFDDALVALGRLDALSAHLPNASLVLYSFVRKEAVLSLQIEGTQSSLADLLLYEIDEQPGVPVEDVREVSRCVAALEHGLRSLRGGLPLSMRLLRGMHEVLLAHPGGRGKTPGEVRRSQVWIGGTRPGNAAFVPPPADALAGCLTPFERFLNDEPESTPPLIKAALAHVQFETIHPFLDGNGRVGRLLITFLLTERGVLHKPVLYLSHYFKRNRQAYYEHLQAVRDREKWEAWLAFFLRGVVDVAGEAADTARRILQLREAHRTAITEHLGRAAGNGHKVLESLFDRPIVTVNNIQKMTGTSYASANSLVARLVKLGVLSEMTGYTRNRRFRYAPYIALFIDEPAASEADA